MPPVTPDIMSGDVRQIATVLGRLAIGSDKTLPGMKHDWRGDWLETMVSLLTKTDISAAKP